MLNVIIVDDNIRTIEGLRKHIPWEDTGCVCIGTATNGVEALKLCRMLPADIVITDVKMPIMDGLELCATLRQEFPGLHLIVISAYDDFEYARNAMVFGVENYILKPINDKKIQELSQFLRKISISAQSYSASLAAFYNSSVVADLNLEIMVGNAGRITNLIQAIFSPLGEDFKAVEDVATHLIASLYHQASVLGVPGAIEGRTLTESMVELQGLHSTPAVIDFVTNRYLYISQFVCRIKDTNKQILAQNVKEYLMANYADSGITTYSLSEKFHISQSYLCHIFKKYENNSINSFLTQIRLDQALYLMGNSDTSIQEIARLVGYPDAHYFSRVFKKVKGLSPSDYKRMMQNHDFASPV